MTSLAWIGALSNIERVDFWSKVKTRKSTRPCWEWTGSAGRSGYGQYRIRGRSVPAHRIAYFDAYGIDPGALFVLHSCDNPRCVNARHMRLGTSAENALDRVATRQMMFARSIVAGRYGGVGYDYQTRSVVSGPSRVHGCSIASAEKISAIRAEFWAGDTEDAIAARHGIAKQTIRSIVDRNAHSGLPLVTGEPAIYRDHKRGIRERRLSDARRLVSADQEAAA